MAETEYTKRVIVIMTGGQLNAANTQAKKTDVKGGEYAWTVGLSPSGKEPATHYWNNWQMTPAEMDQLHQDLTDEIPGFLPNKHWHELSHWDPAIAEPTPDEILANYNPPLKRIEPDLPGSINSNAKN